MPTRVTKRNERRDLALAGAILFFQIACAASASAMDLDTAHFVPEPALKMQSPYKAKITPFVSRDGSRGGFGLFASSGHQTVNLSQPTTWSVNPDASTAGTAVGLGWRTRNLSATMGYVRPSSGASNEAYTSNDGVQRFKPRSMVGIGFALHY